MSKKIELKNIRDTRNRIEYLSSLHLGFRRFTIENKKIIVDALVFLNYKLDNTTSSQKKKFNKSTTPTHSVISSLCSNNKCVEFFNNLAFIETINIQNVIDCYIKTFNLQNHVELNIEKMLQNTDVEHHPLANLAIQLFLLRGNYNWEQYPKTDFMSLVYNDLKDIPSNSVLNCWEAVLVALYKAKLLDIDTLKKTYNYESLPSVPIKIADLFTPDAILSFDKPLNKQLKNRACIISFDKLSHVMLTVPFSQKQILRMLITEDFNEKPNKTKLFSLWTYWTNGSLNTVKKSRFVNDVIYRFPDNLKPICIQHLNLR